MKMFLLLALSIIIAAAMLPGLPAKIILSSFVVLAALAGIVRHTRNTKAIAMETMRVLGVILCWAALLPVVLVSLLGIAVWDKVEILKSYLTDRNSIPTMAVYMPEKASGYSGGKQ